jgi:alpha-L-rhamnosidase
VLDYGKNVGGLITVTGTGRTPSALNGQVTVSVPAGWTASPASFAVDGSEGPASQVVTVHVMPPSGVSGGPVPLTVTASAGGLTAHAQVSVLPYGHWPGGTTATASSYHAPNTVNGQVRTYVPGNAIDGDLATFWNDANPATYPALLTVTSLVRGWRRAAR